MKSQKHIKKHQIARIFMISLLMVGFFYGILNCQIQELSKSEIINNPQLEKMNDTGTEPKSATEYKRYLNFVENYPYGMEMICPSYIQTNENMSNHLLDFKLYNSFQMQPSEVFSYFSLKRDENTIIPPSENPGSNPITHDLSSSGITETIGVYNYEAKVNNKITQKTETKQITVNVTDKISLSPYYDDCKMWKLDYGESVFLEWDLYRPMSALASIQIYIDGSQIDSFTTSSNQISLELNNTHGFDLVGTKNIKIVAQNLDTGHVTENSFVVSVGDEISPTISNFFEQNNQEIYLWESFSNELMSLTVYDNQAVENDIKKVDIYLVDEWDPEQRPRILYHTIPNPIEGQTYSIPLKTLMIEDYLNKYREGEYFENFQLGFKAFIVDDDGNWNRDQYDNYRNIFFNYKKVHNQIQTHQMHVRGGNINITTLNIEYNTYSDYSDYSPDFNLTFVADARQTTRLGIKAATQADVDYCEYDRNPEDNEICQVFYGKDVQNTYIYWGVFFWVVPENHSAIEYPITVKIEYPAEMEPDPNLDEKPLSLLHWNTNNPENSWAEGTWVNVSEVNIAHPSINAKELQIYEPGLYAFGMDSMDYLEFMRNDGGPGVPSYPFEFLLGFVGIAVALIVKRTNSKK